MRIYLCCLLLGLGTWVQAQPGRVTEEEVNAQKVFIEANREKILGNYENAAYLYKEVLKRNSKNHAASYELARIYDVLDKDSEALKAIEQAIKYDNTNPWYRMFLGDIYEKQSNYADAAKVYEALSKEDPNQDYYYYKRAYYLIKAKDTQKAIKVYDELEKRIGITEEVCQKKHRLYLGLGNPKKAAEELEKLIKAYPSEVDYRHALASFYQQIAQLPKAQKEYERILELHPDDARAKIALAGFLKQGGKDVTYLQSLQSIFQKPELDIDAKIKELIPYIHKVAETGDPDLAAAALDLAVILAEVHPQQAKSFSAYGDLLYYSGQREKALPQYQKALQLDDTVFPIWEQVMYIALETNDIEVLEKYATEAIDLFPNQAKAYYFKGIAKSEKKKYDDAIAEFEQALLMSRKKPALKLDLLHRLGLAHFESHQYKSAKEWLSKALDSGGDKNPLILEHYGDVLFQLQDPENALRYWQKALDRGSQSQTLMKKIEEGGSTEQ